MTNVSSLSGPLTFVIVHLPFCHLSSVICHAASFQRALCVRHWARRMVRSQGHGEKSFPASEGFSASTERQGFSVFPKSRVRAADLRALPGRRASACYYQTRYLQQGPLAEIHAYAHHMARHVCSRHPGRRKDTAAPRCLFVPCSGTAPGRQASTGAAQSL